MFVFTHKTYTFPINLGNNQKMAKNWTVEEAMTLDLRKKKLSKELQDLKQYFNKEIQGPFKAKGLFHLKYNSFNKTYDVDMDIDILQVSCRFGGFRLWFLCPRCNGRKMTLHWVPALDNFYCRTCIPLTYNSSQTQTKNPYWKALSTHFKYKEKLEKKGLHWKRKEKYWKKLFSSSQIVLNPKNNPCKRLDAQIKRLAEKDRQKNIKVS